MRAHKPQSDAFRIGRLLSTRTLRAGEITNLLGIESCDAKKRIYNCLANMLQHGELIYSGTGNRYKITQIFKRYIEMCDQSGMSAAMELVKPRDPIPFRPLSAKHMITARGPRDEQYEARPLLSMEALTIKLRKP